MTDNMCSCCGDPIDTDFAEQYWSAPYHYQKGYQDHCLRCWLLGDVADMEEEPTSD